MEHQEGKYVFCNSGTKFGKAGSIMKRRNYRRLVSLIAAGATALSFVSSGGTVLAVSAEAEGAAQGGLAEEGEAAPEGKNAGEAFPEGTAPCGAGAAGPASEGTVQRETPQAEMSQEVPQEEVRQEGMLRSAVSREGAVQEERTSGGVTYETTEDRVHNIYANGQPLLIVASEAAGYAELYIDANGNGTGDEGEEITEFKGDGTVSGNGISYEEGKGYFLAKSIVYGGGKDGDCQYNTCVTLAGNVPGGNEDTTVRIIFGGNAGGTLTGDTCVNLAGGAAGWVFGGGNWGETNGNTSIRMTGGRVAGNMYGGSGSGQINGSTSVSVENAQVNYVFGGNEMSGKVTGDTELVFGENTIVEGWVYGGGAGYSDDAITEVAGSTNIIINGGEFHENIYGGGGWRGAAAGSSNITINDGIIWYSVFGGGEQQSVVTGKASITVNGGDVGGVYASGAGFNYETAEVGEAEIRLTGGKVSSLNAFREEENGNLVIKGGLSVEVSGDTFSNLVCFLGRSGGSAQLNDVKVTLKDTKVNICYFEAPVTGKLAITFDNASAVNMQLAEGVPENAQESVLSYVNCGSPEKGWEEQPTLKGSRLSRSKFTTILLKDSYMNFDDDSTTTQDCTLRACAEKLIVDGGALRVTGIMTSYMPPTEFRNVPLLLRTSEREAVHFDEIPTGTARIRWVNAGVSEDKKDVVFVEGPLEAPDTLFLSGDEGLVLKTEYLQRGVSGGGVIWEGKGWYVGTAEQLCSCRATQSSLEETCFPLSGEGGQTVVTLRDHLTEDISLSQNCKVVGHRENAARFAYSLVSEGTGAPGADINGDQLTVEGAGSVHVKITQYLNGKELEYDDYVQFLEVPDSSLTFTEKQTEELSLSFRGINTAGISISNYADLWDISKGQSVEGEAYSVTSDENTVRYDITKEYLDSLAPGEYGFRASVPYRDAGDNQIRTYRYEFVIEIVPVIVVEDPVIEFPEESCHYDGKPKEPSVVVKDGDAVIPEEEYEVSYQDNVNVGTAVVVITDKPGGRYTVNGRAEFEIVNEYRAVNGTDYLAERNESGWTNKDFVVSAEEGYLLSTGNTLTDDWVEELRRTEETSDGSVIFYVKNTETGLISLEVTESYKLDRTAPEGDIRIDGNSVKTAFEDAGFTGLYRKDVEVKLTAQDSLSGIDGISYLPSQNTMTLDQLEAADGWISEEAFTVSAEDGKQFIVYGRVTDQAGNTGYIASEGGVFDLKAPEAGGVESGGTYYVTQVVRVTDAHPGTVTLNGEAVSGNDVTLPGNREAEYVIEAVDQLGNRTVVRVAMRPVSSLAEPIEELTKDNVTSDDTETVEKVLEAVKGVSGENASREELEELQAVMDACETLDERIRTVQEEYGRIRKEAGEFSVDTVKLTDQEALAKASAAFQTLLEEYGGNYTEDEKSQIEEDLARVMEALESIGRVRAVEDLIAKLPDAEGVSPDDMEAAEAAEQARERLDSLTDHEKALLNTDRLEKLLEALGSYKILEGDGSEWKQGTEGGITFKANGAVSRFEGILIDGQPVDPEFFTAAAGSTVIVLKESLLAALSAGEHSLTVLYKNGQASAKFVILEKGPSATATPTPEPEATPTPEPETTPTPEPETTPTPEPVTTATPTPEPETTPTPEPEATPTPEPEATPTPEPVTTATPEPAATVTPAPSATSTPDPSATSTPEPEATASPAPTDSPVSSEWKTDEDGREYWYENGILQGYHPDDPSYRGREIYDPASDAWYWLDGVQKGAKAVSKDLYLESDAGRWAENGDGTGKWVRYDAEGHMVKGWDTNEDGVYYFDRVYGTMAKGTVTIDGCQYHFDENSGVLTGGHRDGETGSWRNEGMLYWYEGGVRQGYDPGDPSYRGREIYDPASDAWYWLDNVQRGAKAVSKDLYLESDAGIWAESGDGTGKWVRYDAEGRMVKGWDTNENGTYYFDRIYGTMAKGTVTIDGCRYYFDEITGILLQQAE